MMKAAFYNGNKSFVVHKSVFQPVEPGTVRIKVAYCGVCGTDVHIYHGNMDKRVSIPQVIGHEVSGEITEMASDVTGFKVGDFVAVRPLKPGLEDPSDNGQGHIGKNLKFIGIDTPGAMQSYWNVPAYALHKLPANLSLQLGALIEPLAVACHDVRLSGLVPGETAVVLGGGPIGVLVALVAQHKGARVLLSEPNENRKAMAEALGLTVINPVQSDMVIAVHEFTQGAMADVVFEVAGVKATTDVMTEIIRARGRIVMVAIHSEPKPIDLFRVFWRELKLIGVRVYEPEDFEEAIRIAESGKLPLQQLISRVAPIEQIQEVFEEIDNNPEMMKCLIKCN
ncbi:2-desacetyl-2-hydroxyethyl bacteriochlorophyllide A dehydrogenase [Pedobacter sp. AK017]|uniref:zinc-dependent alcohol dehydrogenase n=1 Tax=Pedobacter sp. AK017 TaxID=2723073 RepID=UPI0017ABC406|nr:alcohol dehydrogenase catalytic domain-containing protein [Pedobacter sp. AK017]MBB5441200.1 2-desacetyl-2-hydroxyethyl bacteriochlorophyllide A dehydrogenase [Pedobacter sp. AK017]